MTGPELKALAKEAGLTAKELADRLGLSVTSMSRYQNSEEVPLHIEYAARYLCERRGKDGATSAEERLALIIKEIAGGQLS